MNNRPTRHSYSSIKLWERCPAAWRMKYIDRLPEAPPGKAAKRGTRLHIAAEKYLKDEIPLDKLPVEYHPFEASLKYAKSMGGQAESVWLCGPDWQPVWPTADGKEPPMTWLKAIIDLSYVVNDELYIVDFKSGQVYRDHDAQLELYMIIGAARYPNVKAVHATAWYLDKTVEGRHFRHEHPWLTALRGPWTEKICAIEGDELFPKTPSIPNCRFCQFAQSRGGPCDMEFRDESYAKKA